MCVTVVLKRSSPLFVRESEKEKEKGGEIREGRERERKRGETKLLRAMGKKLNVKWRN